MPATGTLPEAPDAAPRPADREPALRSPVASEIGRAAYPTTGALGPSAPSLRLSHRVLAHLAAQGRLGPGEVATLAFTQAGMAESLGTTQSTLSNVLGRLARAGVLHSELGHVSGQSRRLRVYRLTALGETIAREAILRQRRSSPESQGPYPADPEG